MNIYETPLALYFFSFLSFFTNEQKLPLYYILFIFYILSCILLYNVINWMINSLKSPIYFLGFHAGECRAFVVDGQQVGLVRPDVMKELLNYPQVIPHMKL